MNDTKSMLVFQPDVYRKMLDDAIHCFPDECCGFLFGTENENIRSFTEILVVENTACCNGIFSPLPHLLKLAAEAPRPLGWRGQFLLEVTSFQSMVRYN